MSRISAGLRCLLAGVCLAGSVPPWGWWPLAFIGFALIDRLLAERSVRSRFGRMALVTVAWIYPSTIWMWDMTPPGYLVAGALFALYYGVAAALTPSDWRRRIVFPGAFALAELARWSWPFGGVPLAHMAMSQVDTPVGQVARLGGPALVVVVVVVIGQAISSCAGSAQGSRDAFRYGVVGTAVALALVAGAFLAPRSTAVSEIDAALVQGGGPQRTRASSDQEPIVLARHIEASKAIEPSIDLVLWPENVVNPGRYLDENRAFSEVVQVAQATDAPVLAGWFKPVSDTTTANYQSVINSDGTETDVYDKVRLVPFGEFVPLRGLVVWLAETTMGTNPLPRRNVRIGTAEPVLDTEVGPVGVSISWEGFFEHRARHSVREGAQLLTNPTNGSSYWLTIVQTQQVASNQLRAIENDRWVLQVAPTGLSAVIDPNGKVVQRTDVSERRVLTHTVEMRDGRTLHSRVGWWPVLLYGLAAIAWGLLRPRLSPHRAEVRRSP